MFTVCLFHFVHICLFRFVFTIFSFGDVFWELTSVILIVWGEKGDIEYKEAQSLADLMRFVLSFIGGQGAALLDLYLISYWYFFLIPHIECP